MTLCHDIGEEFNSSYFYTAERVMMIEWSDCYNTQMLFANS